MAGAENPIPLKDRVQERGTRVQETFRGLKHLALLRFRYDHVPEHELPDYEKAEKISRGTIKEVVRSSTTPSEVTLFYRPRRLLGGFVTQEFDYAVDDLRRQRNNR